METNARRQEKPAARRRDAPTDDRLRTDGAGERYEVVIGGDDGLDEQHAELIRSQLVTDSFRDDVVDVRPVEVPDDA